MQGRFNGGGRIKDMKTEQEGRDAFWAGKTEDDCPYGIKRNARAIAWYRGFRESKSFKGATK